MADETDDDLLMREFLSLGQPQGEPEPEPAYQPMGPRFNALSGRPNAWQFGRDLTQRSPQDDESGKLMRELQSRGGRDGLSFGARVPLSGDRLIVSASQR